MKRRQFMQTVGAGLCLSPLNRAAAVDASGRGLPHIVLCMADDQGWGDMAYNGHPRLKTPYFDEMAASSVRFDRFYAAAPVCTPTRGSIMTGRHPNRYGSFTWGRTLRPQEITLAEALRTAGYVTGHFGKWHLGSVRRGSPVNPGASGFDEWLSAPNFFDNDPILSREGVAVQTRGESSMVTVDAALEFIRKHARGPRPFFAVVWFGSPHSPHRALDGDRAPYGDLPEKLQHFYGEITAMDRAFGKLRNELRTLGIRDDTILWYVSDNGGLPEVGSTGGRGHKGQIYEGGLRVPGMLEWPARIQAPISTAVPCSTCDIYPTLIEIAGVEMPNQPPLDGISLVPLLENRMAARPAPMGFWHHIEPGIGIPSDKLMGELLAAQKNGDMLGDMKHLRLDAPLIDKRYPEDSFPGHAAWLDWPWKLHRIASEGKPVRFELYDLAGDPGEENDLVNSEGARVNAMKRDLEAWMVSVVRSLNGGDY